MGSSLKLFGEDFSQALIEATTNPFIGLFIGILSTSVIQSSSSTTSIVVGMVAAGAFSNDFDVSIHLAIPIIMGANIGTSITNTIASLPQMNRSNEFKRAFAAATVHDFFNFLSVLVILPLQLLTDFIGIISTYFGTLFQGMGGLTFLSPVKAITEPIINLLQQNLALLIPNNTVLGVLLLISAIALLLTSLKFMVSSLKALIFTKAKSLFDKYLFKSSLRAFSIGIVITVLVQSSSITTSLVVPIAGAGLLSLVKIFPYTLGANIGTTITAIFAALVTGSLPALVVAFAHLFFNISGILFWWPFKIVPITIAEKFAEYSANYKIVPILYILILFFIVPLTVIYFSS
jgi:sodium-dependent phosphate cotransporter